MGKHLEQALPSVYTLQCLTGKVDNNNNNNTHSPGWRLSIRDYKRPSENL